MIEMFIIIDGRTRAQSFSNDGDIAIATTVGFEHRYFDRRSVVELQLTSEKRLDIRGDAHAYPGNIRVERRAAYERT